MFYCESVGLFTRMFSHFNFIRIMPLACKLKINHHSKPKPLGNYPVSGKLLIDVVVVDTFSDQISHRPVLCIQCILCSAKHQESWTGWPRSLEIRENRENGQNKFPAGKNQGISKLKKNQGIIREFYKKWRKEMCLLVASLHKIYQIDLFL